ncbi:hypothetical protein ACO0LG_29315 [Undibacterium sp. Ji42W]|uniref:hypothetical protein n=1 Tax=Undibacterium sp. Ji42W TaxID=3413039 RepID=UPI003BF0119A
MLEVKKLFIVILLACVTQIGFAATPNRVLMFERTNVLTTKLIEYLKKKSEKFGKSQIEDPANTEIMNELDRLIAREKNPAVLARVALYARMLGDYGFESREDDSEVIDVVLLEIWFACLNNIKKIGGVDALAALNDMKRTISLQTLDGAVSLAFRKAREEVEEGIKAKDNKAKTASKLPTLTK